MELFKTEIAAVSAVMRDETHIGYILNEGYYITEIEELSVGITMGDFRVDCAKGADGRYYIMRTQDED